jgi:hypothetical protein
VLTVDDLQEPDIHPFRKCRVAFEGTTQTGYIGGVEVVDDEGRMRVVQADGADRRERHDGVAQPVRRDDHDPLGHVSSLRFRPATGDRRPAACDRRRRKRDHRKPMVEI